MTHSLELNYLGFGMTRVTCPACPAWAWQVGTTGKATPAAVVLDLGDQAHSFYLANQAGV